jgi:signal recognition particle subunit SRP54
MFESLQDGLRGAFKTLRGKGKLTEANMRDGLRLLEQTLVEADVGYEVVRDFMDHVTERALGEKVLLSLNPDEQLMHIVYQELVQLLGPEASPIRIKKDALTILMVCGLQGSGKTTTCGKLAKLIEEEKKHTMLVAADLQRPAAIEQLRVLGEQIGVPVYIAPGEMDPVKVCRDAVKEARKQQVDVVILDTAGRLAIDRELMAQLQRIDSQVNPDQVVLVVDGMTGQDAVNSARAFNEALELDGVIMTKLDGDARGGALLSVKHVTGVPVKFIGTGEHLDALELFRPDGMAGRILGAGDLAALVDLARRKVDEEAQKKAQEDLEKGQFTLDTFKTVLKQFQEPGLMMRMLQLMGMTPDMKEMLENEDAEGGMKRMVGMIDSMTPAERRNPKLIDPSRRNRIAKGAGVQPHEVSGLVKQYDMMSPMFKHMAGMGVGDRMKLAKQMQTSGMLNPGAQFRMKKGDTGKRLTSDERRQKQKLREKLKRQKKKKR